MNIEFSIKTDPLDHIMIEEVVSYTQTNSEILIFTVNGLATIIDEEDIEDFCVYGLGE
jgi:hypothetical protein